jgi:acylglycerol lipase
MRFPKSEDLRRVVLVLAAAAPLVGCATPAPPPKIQPVAHYHGASGVGSHSKPSTQILPKRGHGEWVSCDGAAFPCTHWGPVARPKTVIVAVHGLSGAASDFEPLGEYFSKRSTAVYSYALRGQGNDPVKKRVGDIKKPELWYADLDAFLDLVRASNPKARLFLYGESLGGLISVHGLETLSGKNREAIRGLILSSPVVSLKDREEVSWFRYAVLKGATKLLPRRMISLEKLAGDKEDMHITGDKDHRENILNTPHAVDKFSFRLLGTLENLIDGSREKASKIDMPILVLYPAHDLLTTAEDVENWYGYLETRDKEKQLFSKSYHLLLHDRERAAVLERVRAWLELH